MTSISDKDKLEAISTTYKTEIFEAAYEKSGENAYQAFCAVDEADGEFYQMVGFLGNPRMQEWVGGKTYDAMRAYNHTIKVTPKHASVEISKASLRGDKLSVIAKKLASFLSEAASHRNDQATTALSGGFGAITGFDGVSLFSAAHPFGPNGGTNSNTQNLALNSVNLETAIVAMQSWRDENGNPFGRSPTVLMVGPHYVSIAKQLVEHSERVYSISDTGVEANSGVDGVTSSENDKKSLGIRVVMNPRLVGDMAKFWFLIDDKTAMKPIVCAQQGDPEPTDDTAEYTEKPVNKFSVEHFAGYGAGPWMCVWGSNYTG
jgi:phage major head subunit gpT-like protein